MELADSGEEIDVTPMVSKCKLQNNLIYMSIFFVMQPLPEMPGPPSPPPVAPRRLPPRLLPRRVEQRLPRRLPPPSAPEKNRNCKKLVCMYVCVSHTHTNTHTHTYAH